MVRFYVLIALIVAGLFATLAAAIGGWGWVLLIVIVVMIGVVAVFDLTQTEHAILRNYPVIGHLRFLMESIRPELQQYFIERNFDGTPFDRNTRSSIYQRAKDVKEEHPFGTERDLYETAMSTSCTRLRRNARWTSRHACVSAARSAPVPTRCRC